MRYNSLAQHPYHFQAFTGLKVGEFDRLCVAIHDDWYIQHLEKLKQKNPKPKRKPGAGHPFALPAIEDRLLLTLIWAKLYPSGLLLEYLFGIDESTVGRTIKDMTPLLKGRFLLSKLKDWHKGKKQLRTIAELKSLIPDLDAILADATEQKILRPKDGRKRRPYHSGKKRAFTVKTQIAVNTKGLIIHASPTVGGRTHDYRLFKKSGLPQVIPKGTPFYGDSGYQGVARDYPFLDARLPKKRTPGIASLTRSQKIANKKQRRVRIVAENTICQLKKYEVLNQAYRHDRRNYNIFFQFVANIVNFRMLERQTA